MDESYRCAVCGCGEIAPWFSTSFGAIGRCHDCGQVLRVDRPDRSAQVKLHQTSDLHLCPYALVGEHASADLKIYNRFLKFCECRPQGRILDVGCSTGEFLKLAISRGFQPAGIEPIRELRVQAEQRLDYRSLSN